MKNRILTIDCAKWRCGDGSHDNGCLLGKGNTFLLNEQGSMCCLGQIALQLKPALKPSNLLNKMFPQQASRTIQLLVNKNGSPSALTNRAILINDDFFTPVREKMSQLRALFKTKNITLRFINQHVIPK